MISRKKTLPVLSFIGSIIFLMVIISATPPSLPFDQLSVQATVTSMNDSLALLRIDRIDNYTKGPVQVAPKIKIGQEVTARIYYVAVDNRHTSLSDIILGQKYSVNLEYCSTVVAGIGCSYEGWNAAIYPAKDSVKSGAGEQMPPVIFFRAMIVVALFLIACLLYKEKPTKTKNEKKSSRGK
jgi:hypothetical protein